jgi:hypothetical protein
MVYADTYKYLKHRERGFYALAYKGTMDEFDELDMTQPFDFKISGNVVIFEGGKLAFSVDGWDYVSLKTTFVKKRYSNDDQIAIMLNYPSSEASDIMAYEKMQEWRNFAGDMAKQLERLHGG